MPVVPRYYFGFVDRLRIDYLFRRGELHGRALEIAIENGVLKHHGLLPRGILVD